MLSLTLYLFSLLLLLLSLIDCAPPYTPTEYILLNCGSSSNATSPDGRNWEGDTVSKFSPFNRPKTSSSTASEQDPSVTQVPYMTARISHSLFTYIFPVSPGPKFVRLYFYPATYSGLDKSKFFFSIIANRYTLLSNFSAFLTVSATNPPAASLVKEFCINVPNNKGLTITFFSSSGAYAFINGIEIVSMPNNLYMLRKDNQVPFINFDTFFTLDDTTALETLYRLNVGGQDVSVNDDTGMFRIWHDDSKYIWGAGFGVTQYQPGPNVTIRYSSATPAYTAPAIVYSTYRSMGPDYHINVNYNLTWMFTIDSGFDYLVRLHFCEAIPLVTSINQRVFSIYINNQTAERDADVISWSGGTGIPVFRDYAVLVPDPYGTRGKQDLWLALHPNMDSGPQYGDAILNGLEIFKLNRSDGSFSAPNPDPPVGPMSPQPYSKLPVKEKIKGPSRLIIAVTGVVLAGGVLVLLSLLYFLIHRRRPKEKSPKTKVPSLPEELCRKFTLAEIQTATNSFDEALVIGNGGFGRVYKGHIDGHIPVAIKRLTPKSLQGAHEFCTEIEMLSRLRHRHLVSLIGYCNEERQMMLVYDYMARGTFREHLYKTDNPPLSWKKRLEVCIGAARGFEYLHAGAEHTIIHRDVKTANILLDESWVAKVSDFGLSKMGPTIASCSHVSTDVKGTFGYLDPEYFWTHHLTEKSDVYAFGVVLFEVLCARAAVDMDLEEQQHSLAQWARYCVKNGTIDQIIDPYLTGKIAPECLRVFTVIADKCIRERRNERPKIGEVVWSLEFALELQESADATEEGIMIDGAHREMIDERMLSCGDRNQMGLRPPNVDDVVHSCPEFWQKDYRALNRCSSDKTGLKWADSPTCRGAMESSSESCSLTSAAKYVALPGDHKIWTDSRTTTVHVTAGEASSEIKISEGR